MSGESPTRGSTTPIMALALLVVLGLWLGAASDPEGRWAELLDNAHWTLATTVAALVAWWSLRWCPAEDARPRRWLALAMTGMALGQWIWNVQVLSGWNPFPGPADAAYLLLGLFTLVGIMRVGRRHLDDGRWRHARMDMSGFGLATLTLVLTIFLPRDTESTPLQLAVLMAYPVLLISALAAVIIVLLNLRVQFSARWLAILAGLAGQCVAWLAWNIDALDGFTGNGSPVNLVFSVSDVLFGWGAAGIRLQSDTTQRFDRLCEGVIRQLPLAMIGMTSISVGLLVLDEHLPVALRGVLLAMSVAALLSAPFRQARMLGERDRMLAAERGLAESRARLEYLAHHDALTGLANLAQLRERVNQAIAAADRTGQGVALLFIDMDQFKEVNDTLGHATGDALLAHTARQLQSIVRGSDTVCRHGGDEFAIVLPGVKGVGEVVRVTDKIMGLAEQNASINGHELPMSMSIGAAFYPHDARTFESLLQCADIAMYQAKAAGRNAYRFFDAQMSADASNRAQLRGQLARAVERGELALHYQPIVHLPGRRIVGAEALLRWQHPELGNVPPSDFIPVAEKSGLIVPIGAWVLQEACRQAAAWHAAGLGNLSIAVNLSVLQFRRGNLEKVVLDALRASGLPPRFLELEVTESVLVEQRDAVTTTLERLRRFGIRVSIDDFGTGYCNIAYLKQLPATKLKMDQSLTRDIAGSPRDAGIARTIIQLAHELELTTVAEGVETDPQCQLLQGYGCDQAQGYLFSRAVPGEEFASLCRTPLAPLAPDAAQTA